MTKRFAKITYKNMCVRRNLYRRWKGVGNEVYGRHFTELSNGILRYISERRVSQ